MKKRVIVLVFGVWFSSSELHAQTQPYSFPVSERIIQICNGLKTVISEKVLHDFMDSLTSISEEGNEHCFISLGEYNGCEDSKDQLYARLFKYMDDLSGKQIRSVQLEEKRRLWDDEDYYHLRISFHYVNDDPAFDVEENFDTIIFGVNEGKVKNITYAREWIHINEYGN